METKSFFEPTDPTLKALDQKIEKMLNNLDHSQYDGPEYKLAIGESNGTTFKPCRVIWIEGLNGYMEIDQYLGRQGLTNLIPETPHSVKGYDGIYLLEK
jgi:hypothetical protein